MKKNRKVTAESVTINFRNYGKITIPKGVLVTNETAMGIDDKYNFVDEFDWIDRLPSNSTIIKNGCSKLWNKYT